ncbi:pyridoxal phosphate-dependent aminotransferase [Aminipila butyrica]|uniref:Pyridoxal phosphate-dependent aminotransferase n=1 Tax=Aminipila butyrica TaxID=433296 RepID=A0A858BTM1_9FIRM|nr:pyridoxal phosphate-dependent aminotransferase [Aminipila butyrica]QIB68907.1 pyridoxal phosphate-dependent aminotransferase [Aminipila butyrica]
MKDKFIAKRYWKDGSTPMGKVDELAKKYEGVINLSLGDPDLTTPEVIIDRAFADARAGHTKYTDFRGDPELRQEIAAYYKERFGLSLGDEEIFVAASGCLGMYLVLEAILDEGDEVILQAPYFTPYPQQVELARGVAVEFPMLEEEDFRINIKRLEQTITARTKAIVINSPNNPTGNCLSEQDLENIARIAKKYDLIVISDEIYTAYSYQEPFVPIMSLEGMRERTVTINSFSKDYIMTGWRVGNIIAPPNIIRTIQQINENVVFTAPSISQRAAIYAMRHRQEFQADIVGEYRRRAEYGAKRINEISWMSVIEPPKGTFYLFANVKKTGLSSEEVSRLILEQAKVLTIPGNAFGDCGEGYIRLACTVSMEVLKEAFDRMEQIRF